MFTTFFFFFFFFFSKQILFIDNLTILFGPVTQTLIQNETIYCLFVLRLNVPVNNFSVMSGRRQYIVYIDGARAYIKEDSSGRLCKTGIGLMSTFPSPMESRLYRSTECAERKQTCHFAKPQRECYRNHMLYMHLALIIACLTSKTDICSLKQGSVRSLTEVGWSTIYVFESASVMPPFNKELKSFFPFVQNI